MYAYKVETTSKNKIRATRSHTILNWKCYTHITLKLHYFCEWNLKECVTDFTFVENLYKLSMVNNMAFVKKKKKFRDTLISFDPELHFY